MPNHELRWKFEEVFAKADIAGGWAKYAVDVGGEADTGDMELDAAIENLYRANEIVHLVANKLRLRHGLEF